MRTRMANPPLSHLHAGLFGAVVALSLLCCAVTEPARAARLEIPSYRTVTLDNGLTLLIMEKSTVPMVSLEMWIDAGAANDPAGKEGLASLTAGALRKGAGDRDAQAFAEALDYLGAEMSTSVDEDRVRIHMDLQSKDLDAGLALFADAVLRPRFDGDEVDKLAAQMAESVVQAKDNPRNVLTDYFRALLYGDHPYGHPVDGTETSLPSLGRDDVVKFYGDHYGADRAFLAVAGDIDSKTVEKRLRGILGGMPEARSSRLVLKQPTAPTATRVLLVNKTDTPQTWFMIGGLGPAWGEDDYAATEVVRTIFGGRFTSWLNSKLRIETGLTYGARYSIDRGRVRGYAAIRTYTATATTKKAFDLALAQLDRLHEQGIGAEDLASAKAYLKGQLPYDYETADDLAGAMCQLAYYGLDRSMIDELFEHIDAVTLEDCKKSVQKWFTRKNLVITAIGVQEDVASILRSYGPLTVRENATPGFD